MMDANLALSLLRGNVGLGHLRADIADLIEQQAAMLKRLEWTGKAVIKQHPEDTLGIIIDDICPECASADVVGHAENCELKALIPQEGK